MVDKTEKPKSEGAVEIAPDKAVSTKKAPVKSKPASNASKKDVQAKTSSAKTPSTKTPSTKTSVATKNNDSTTTKKVGGGTKSHPVSAERLKAAEDAIKKKPIESKSPESQATIDLKQRAHNAKKRAQEAILSKSYVSDPADPLVRLADRFDSTTKRWEMVIYPSMFAFILLAGYGFYLIYHLTRDISTLSTNVSQMATIVTDVMPKMSKNLSGMTGSIDNMSTDVTDMTQGV